MSTREQLSAKIRELRESYNGHTTHFSLPKSDLTSSFSFLLSPVKLGQLLHCDNCRCESSPTLPFKRCSLFAPDADVHALGLLCTDQTGRRTRGSDTMKDFKSSTDCKRREERKKVTEEKEEENRRKEEEGF
ncbi:hypothetical protein MLD38_029324 [Melastoma candidum]|uniref:Uncharacterized protein n=1 Tax=Melastoma candidum TaxID=119954 RepID=A0ACB9N489_9MYRT|nr:hypothetical protein MLD38_029324 [Melastoma candidum]